MTVSESVSESLSVSVYVCVGARASVCMRVRVRVCVCARVRVRACVCVDAIQRGCRVHSTACVCAFILRACATQLYTLPPTYSQQPKIGRERPYVPN